MDKLYFSIVLSFLLISCTTKQNLFKVEKDLNAVKYANTITEKELSDHLYIFASDKFLGRETGKKGQKLAEEYIIKSFKKNNVAPGNNGVYTQYFDVVESMPPRGTISIDENKYHFNKDFFFFNSFSTFKSFEFDRTDWVDFGFANTSLDILKDKEYESIKDKIVFIRVHNGPGITEKDNYTWRRKLALADSLGAKQVFFVDTSFEARLNMLQHYLEGSTMELAEEVSNDGETIPFYFIHKRMFHDMVQTKGSIDVDIVTAEQKLTSSNVLGFIEGSDPVLKKEVIILTAHYDHIGVKGQDVYNGADDDGTGSVTLLELAQAFQMAKNDGFGPKRSILVMPVSGEEKGLLGSKYYTKHPVFPLENTLADLNTDMIGRTDSLHDNSNYVYLIGADRLSNDLHVIS